MYIIMKYQEIFQQKKTHKYSNYHYKHYEKNSYIRKYETPIRKSYY